MVVWCRASFAVVAVGIATAIAVVHAIPEFRRQIPNGFNVPGHMALGHACPSGASDERNAFGEAFDASGHLWTKALCEADTDGDGQSNGVELGDPNCVWTPGQQPERTWEISDPSLSSSVSALSPKPAPPNLFPSGAVAVTRSSRYAILGGVAAVNWTVWATAPFLKSTDVLEVQLSISTDQYVAFGVAASGMNGAMTACYVTDSASGYCTDLVGNSFYQVSRRPQHTLVVASALSGGNRTVVLRSQVAVLGNLTGVVRAIFAYGEWDAAGSFPLQHGGASAYSAPLIDIYGGRLVEDTVNTEAWATQSVGVVITLILGIVGWRLNRAQFVPTHAQRLAFIVGVGLTYSLLLIVIFFASRSGYQRLGKSAPDGRACGDVVTFLFFLVMWPTSKHLGPVRLAGISYERFLLPHQLLGCLIFAAITSHGWLLWSQYESSGACAGAAVQTIFRWDTRAPTLNGAGPICWLLLAVMIIPAIFLRRWSFRIFRSIHMLFVFVLLFGALHHWPLLLFVAPGLCCWIADVGFRLRSHLVHAPRVESATYIAEADVIDLRLSLRNKSFVPQPGQYAFIGFTRMMSFLHPFSLVRYENGIIRFFIKPRGEGSWTKALQRAIEQQAALGDVLWCGPYGLLQVPLHFPHHIALVAGGIGVTPMLSTLQYIADQRSAGGLSNLESVSFLWSVRNRALARLVADLVRSDLGRLAGLRVTATIHLTKPDLLATSAPSLPAPSLSTGSRDPPASVEAESSSVNFVEGRPDFDQQFALLGGAKAAVYVCGPASMVDAVSAAATRLKLPLSVERFEL